jgi:hypothetical protein
VETTAHIEAKLLNIELKNVAGIFKTGSMYVYTNETLLLAFKVDILFV